MLLVFKGKDCTNCPFLTKELAPQPQVYYRTCTLSNRIMADREKLPELEVNTSGMPRPAGCPFRHYPGSIEIQAEEI